MNRPGEYAHALLPEPGQDASQQTRRLLVCQQSLTGELDVRAGHAPRRNRVVRADVFREHLAVEADALPLVVDRDLLLAMDQQVASVVHADDDHRELREELAGARDLPTSGKVCVEVSADALQIRIMMSDRRARRFG